MRQLRLPITSKQKTTNNEMFRQVLSAALELVVIPVDTETTDERGSMLAHQVTRKNAERLGNTDDKKARKV